MPETGSAPLKNPKHELYAVGRASGLSRKDAQANAGYIRSAGGGGSTTMLEKCIGVLDRIVYLQKQAADQMLRTTAVHQATSRNQLTAEALEVYRIAMTGSPVQAKNGQQAFVIDDEGEKHLIFKPDLTAALRSIELRGKLGGQFIDVTVDAEDLDSVLEGKTPKELNDYILSLVEQVDPNLTKSLKEQLDATPDEQPDAEAPLLQ